MKKIFLLSILTLVFLSCDKNKTELIGTYKMTAQYIDPGDGSGDFEPVSSSRTIEFHSDGTVTSNGNLCDLSTDTDESTSGTYDTSDSTLTIQGCENNTIRFSFDEGILILFYPCIEACQVKYEKI